MISLRPYQASALEDVLAACMEERYLLLHAATAAGKTIFFSSLIKHCIENFEMRVAVIAHREILIRQAYDKLLKVWPEGRDLIGIACASVSAKSDLDKPVLIASPQTLAHRLDGLTTPIHWVILDECHRVPPKNVPSQYRTLLETMEQSYPELRVLGVTATPYRLGHGRIYGESKKGKNWWPKLHCQVGIKTLQGQGFLSLYRAKEAEDISSELSGVKLSGGDYNLAALGEVMGKGIHVNNAVSAVQRHAADRKSIVVFCTTIAHAEAVSEAFCAAGIESRCVHSKLPQDERHATLDLFDSGRLRVVCNVGVLTEGWDSTGVDCIVMCRPTKSPALYVQIVGRGLRLHEGKADCLILDLSGNCMAHGDPDDPIVISDRREKAKPKPSKACPECEEIVKVGTFECPACGYEWPRPVVVEAKPVTSYRDVTFKAASAPQALPVASWRVEDYTSKKGNRMAKLTVYCKTGTLAPLAVAHYFDLDGAAGEYSRVRAHRWLSGRAPGYKYESLEKFVADSKNILSIPDCVTVVKDGDFNKIYGW